VPHHQSSEVKEPSKHALYFPSTHIASKAATILRGPSPVLFIGRDHLDAVFVLQLFVQPVAVIRLVSNQALGHLSHHPLLQRPLHQFHFRWRSTFCPQGERKTMAVCKTHDLGALAPLGFPDPAPPFLAGTNVPSTKHSLRSSPPASCRCWASVQRIRSITPER